MTIAAAAVAQTTTALPSSYQIVCKSEQSIGYNWKGGTYVKAQFTLDTYLITVGDTKYCKADASQDYKSVSVEKKGVCASITRVGNKPYPEFARQCHEVAYPEERSVTLKCHDEFFGDFAANPDGWFHLNSMHGNTGAKPKDDRKDSQSLEVGKCSRVS